MTEINNFLKYFLITTVFQSFAKGVLYIDHQSDDALSSHSSHSSNGNHADQLYGPWSDWSPCSRSCGMGVSRRTRACNLNVARSKYRDDNLCHRDSAEHRICTLQRECPSDATDSRASLCSRYNGRLVAGQRAKSWIPTNQGSNPCELRCEALEERLVYGFGKVEDGTPCEGGLCVDGRCLKIGCDDKLGSPTEVDMCGVCGGRNQSCVHYKDLFLGQPEVQLSDGPRRNYFDVVVLPVGARNFEIKQRIGDNMLAMRDRNTAILLHEEGKRKDHKIAGSLLTYSTEDSNTTEVFRASGPTTLELHVLVLLRSKNYGIHYQYWLPRDRAPDQKFFPTRTTASYDPKTRTSLPPTRTTYKSLWTTPTRSISVPPVYRRPAEYTTPRPPEKYLPYDRKTSSNYTSKTSQPIYGPKRKALLFPPSSITSSPSYKAADESISHSTLPETDENRFSARNGALLPFIPNYRTRKPVYNYYQQFRNTSFRSPVNIYRQNLDPVLHQTQRDSSDSNSKPIVETIPKKPTDTKTEIAYRDTNVHSFGHGVNKPNSRWEYKFNGKKNNNHAPGGKSPSATAVSISVLPLPQSRNHTKLRREKKITGLEHQPKTAHFSKGVCGACHKVKNQAKHFCSSDFVIRATVLGYEFFHGETRYELQVLQSFKNTFPLLPREYVWSPDNCKCPKLRIGKEYVIMGRSDNNFRRNESRLLVDRHSFVRTYSLKQDHRLLKLRKNHKKRCSSKVS